MQYREREEEALRNQEIEYKMKTKSFIFLSLFSSVTVFSFCYQLLTEILGLASMNVPFYMVMALCTVADPNLSKIILRIQFPNYSKIPVIVSRVQLF